MRILTIQEMEAVAGGCGKPRKPVKMKKQKCSTSGSSGTASSSSNCSTPVVTTPIMGIVTPIEI